jgi:hypothetical protein
MVTFSCFLIVLLAGAAGGLVNALLTDNGFAFPRAEYCNGVKFLRPGVLGNCIVSSAAAFISWGLYGPAATVHMLGSTPGTAAPPTPLSVTVGTIAGALLVGVAGARWLTSEVDKSLLRAAATQAATASRDVELAQRLAMANPAAALELAKQAHSEQPAAAQ